MRWIAVMLVFAVCADATTISLSGRYRAITTVDYGDEGSAFFAGTPEFSDGWGMKARVLFEPGGGFGVGPTAGAVWARNEVSQRETDYLRTVSLGVRGEARSQIGDGDELAAVIALETGWASVDLNHDVSGVEVAFDGSALYAAGAVGVVYRLVGPLSVGAELQYTVGRATLSGEDSTKPEVSLSGVEVSLSFEVSL
jgi:hypothetical protein